MTGLTGVLPRYRAIGRAKVGPANGRILTTLGDGMPSASDHCQPASVRLDDWQHASHQAIILASR